VPDAREEPKGGAKEAQTCLSGTPPSIKKGPASSGSDRLQAHRKLIVPGGKSRNGEKRVPFPTTVPGGCPSTWVAKGRVANEEKQRKKGGKAGERKKKITGFLTENAERVSWVGENRKRRGDRGAGGGGGGFPHAGGGSNPKGSPLGVGRGKRPPEPTDRLLNLKGPLGLERKLVMRKRKKSAAFSAAQKRGMFGP